jgi:hypothetical protein
LKTSKECCGNLILLKTALFQDFLIALRSLMRDLAFTTSGSGYNAWGGVSMSEARLLHNDMHWHLLGCIDYRFQMY